MVSGDVVPHTNGTEPPGDFRQWFLDHPVHRALGECMKLRPPVNISVQ
jgi:hypothetical protein